MHVGIGLREALGTLEPLVDEARVVIAEVDLTDPTVVPTIRKEAQLKPGKHAANLYRPRDFSKLVEKTQLDAHILDQLRPWFPMTLLVQRAVESVVDAPLPRSMDLELLEGAMSRGQRVHFLETARDQAAVMNRIPTESIVTMVSDLLNEEANTLTQLDRMLTAYRQGEATTLESLLFGASDMGEHPEYYEELYARRNARWLPTLTAELREGDAFVAVGVGHMFSPYGLLAQLHDAGFSVTRLAPPALKDESTTVEVATAKGHRAVSRVHGEGQTELGVPGVP